jgi:hypothetical protein
MPPTRSAIRAATPRILLVSLLALTPATACAYIDPNAGGLLYQLLFPLIAGIVSVYVFLKQWVVRTAQRLGRMLLRLLKRE